MTQKERNNIFKSIGFIEAMYTFNGYIDSDTYKRYKNLCKIVNLMVVQFILNLFKIT